MTAALAVVLAGCAGPQFMPSVTGLTENEVIEVMDEIGLEAKFRSTYSDLVPAGVALSSEPSAGQELEGERTVWITISKGPEPAPEPPPEPEPWAPAGFTEITDNVAFRWAEPTGDPCGGPPCLFWRAEVVTRAGCPSGVYAEINILNGNRVIDWTNANLSALSPDQIGALTFTHYGSGNSPSGFSAELTDLSCR